jgi:hypothetical protein
LRTSVFLVSFVTLLPVGLGAQTATPAVQVPAAPPVYGGGEQTPLRYEGEAAPVNQLMLSVGASTFYDDNVPQMNSIRIGDEAVSINSQLAVYRQTERLKLDFSYLPNGVVYRKVDQYNNLNHNVGLNALVRVSSRVNLGLHETFSYLNGIFQSLTGQPISSGLGSATALNQAILPYVTRTYSDTSGVDLTFVKSGRTSLTFSAGYNLRGFTNQGQAGRQLYNSWGVNGGLEYKYRISEHTNLGVLMVHQDSTFRGNGVTGNGLRFQSESPLVTIASRLSPTTTVTVFGGPQYIRVLGNTAAAGATGQFQGAGGANITEEVRHTALSLSAQRTVSDGGGTYTLVKNTSLDLGVRRQLMGRWEAAVHIGAARANTSLFQLASGTTNALTGGVRLDRPLSWGATLHASYETAHETSSGDLPYLAKFDRNRVAIGIDYRFKTIPLGR